MEAKRFKLVPSCPAGGIVIWYNPFRIQFSNIHREPKNVCLFFHFNPETLLLEIHPKEIIFNIRRMKPYLQVFIIIA